LFSENRFLVLFLTKLIDIRKPAH